MGKVAKRRGRYVLDYYDSQNMRRRVTLKKGTTKKAAEDALLEIENQIAKGIHIPESETPLFSEVAKEWIEQRRHDPDLRRHGVVADLCRCGRGRCRAAWQR